MGKEKILNEICEILCNRGHVQKTLDPLGYHLDNSSEEVSGETKIIDDLGLDSMDVIEVIQDIEDKFSIDLEVSPDMKMLNDLAEKVAKLIN